MQQTKLHKELWKLQSTIMNKAAMFIPDLQTVKKCLADSNMMSIYHAKGFYS